MPKLSSSPDSCDRTLFERIAQSRLSQAAGIMSLLSGPGCVGTANQEPTTPTATPPANPAPETVSNTDMRLVGTSSVGTDMRPGGALSSSTRLTIYHGENGAFVLTCPTKSQLKLYSVDDIKRRSDDPFGSVEIGEDCTVEETERY